MSDGMFIFGAIVVLAVIVGFCSWAYKRGKAKANITEGIAMILCLFFLPGVFYFLGASHSEIPMGFDKTHQAKRELELEVIRNQRYK